MRVFLWLYLVIIVIPVEIVAIPKLFDLAMFMVKPTEEPLLILPILAMLFLLFELLLFIPILLASEPPTALGADIAFDIQNYLERQNVKKSISIESIQKVQ